MGAQQPGTGMDLYLCRIALAHAVTAAIDRATTAKIAEISAVAVVDAASAVDPESFWALDDAGRAAVLVLMDRDEQVMVLPMIAASDALAWLRLIQGLDPVTAEIVANKWDVAGDASAEWNAQLFECPLGDAGAALAKHALRTARDKLARVALMEVMAEIGYPDRHVANSLTSTVEHMDIH